MTATRPLLFYFGDSKTAAPSPEQPLQQVDPGEQTTVTAQNLGASATHKYLMVQNKTAAPGHWQVEI